MLLLKQCSSGVLVSGNTSPVLYTSRLPYRVGSLPVSRTHSSQCLTMANLQKLPISSSGKCNPVLACSASAVPSSSHESSPISENDEDKHVHGVSEITVGVLGGGQLGRMLCQAASQMAINVVILDPSENCSASSLAYGHMVDSFDDSATVEEFAKRDCSKG